MSDSRLPLTVSLIEHGIAQGLHTGAQLYVSRNDEIVADFACGLARPDTALQTDTLMLWMSATKPVTAVAIAQLWQNGKLDLDDPVARFIPEFAVGGKQDITLRHCLTHTAGFRGPVNNFTPGPWDHIIARICNLRQEPDWIPGRKAGYHAATSWFILAEIVQRQSATPFADYVRQQIFLPLQMNDCWIGMPSDKYRQYANRIALLPAIEPDGPNYQTPPNTPEAAFIPRPGANGRGPMRELAKFYEMLLTHAPAILSPQSIEAITCPHRVGMFDHSFQFKIDWSLGFLINSNHYGIPETPYQYGPHASRRTFGHSGNQSSVAFADPEHNLVVCLAFNGLPGEIAHQQRTHQILASLYSELHLT